MISSIYSLITGHVICNHCFIRFIFLIEKLCNFSLFNFFFLSFFEGLNSQGEISIPPKGLLLVTHEPSSVSTMPGPHIRGSALRAMSVGDREVDVLLPGTGRYLHFFISYLFYLAEIKLKSTNSIIMHVDSQEPFRFLLFAYQFVPYPA